MPLQRFVLSEHSLVIFLTQC